MTDRLGDARRRIGTTNEAARRGFDNGAARRAIGARIEAERRGASVQDDINSLVRPARQRPALRTIAARGSLPVQRGRADYKPPATNSGGSGIASPLIETSYAARTYWPSLTVTSTDGLRSFVIKPIKEITQTDANAAEVKQQFAQPVVAP
ncbi:MAG: hypothetical protein K2X80_07770 [Pseudomonadaceae bacterium]|nr:hypothetical protein [Pseudomonadaceae bacterium]